MFGKRWARTVGAAGTLAAAVSVAAAQEPVDRSAGIEKLDARLTRRVIALLPAWPPTIWVVDADAARPEVRETLLKLDAFVLKEQADIYLVKQSRVLQGALEGFAVHECMLACIIWHEMAHLEGADESEAQRREEVLWTGFLLNRFFDRITGLRYLDILKKRHPSPRGSDPCGPRNGASRWRGAPGSAAGECESHPPAQVRGPGTLLLPTGGLAPTAALVRLRRRAPSR